tara:strand:+ start:3690 stop:4115 length:426 start_codon:yes stop_codon:yes gene_type:complete
MAIAYCQIINGDRWVYRKLHWIKVDRKGNLIKEYYNGKTKLVYFDGYGYQPHTFKSHQTREEQLEYCESVKCGGCYCCVWAEDMIPKITKKKVIKEKISKSEEHIPTKFDNASKRVFSKQNYDRKHPLYDYIKELFDGEEI